jgi:hypothetical protein
MDVRDLNWTVRPAGDTLLQQIEAMAKEVGVPSGKQRDLRWMAENLRTIASNDEDTCKALLGYVQHALQQGLDFLG